MVLSVYAENDGTFDFNGAVNWVIQRLCSVLLTPAGGSPYALAWSRTDGFILEGTNIAGQELQFDILEYPSQETSDPDPIDAVNAYLKDVFPEALVLWYIAAWRPWRKTKPGQPLRCHGWAVVWRSIFSALGRMPGGSIPGQFSKDWRWMENWICWMVLPCWSRRSAKTRPPIIYVPGK